MVPARRRSPAESTLRLNQVPGDPDGTSGEEPAAATPGLVKRGQEFIRVGNRCSGPSAGVRWAWRVEAVGPEAV